MPISLQMHAVAVYIQQCIWKENSSHLQGSFWYFDVKLYSSKGRNAHNAIQHLAGGQTPCNSYCHAINCCLWLMYIVQDVYLIFVMIALLQMAVMNRIFEVFLHCYYMVDLGSNAFHILIFICVVCGIAFKRNTFSLFYLMLLL